MKIILVRPCWTTRWMIVPPLGFGYISSAAKRHGHIVSIYDAWLKNKNPIDAANEVLRYDVDIIGVQIFKDSIPWAKTFINRIKARSDVRIVIGGPYVTVLGEKARAELNADIAIQREFDHDLDKFIPLLKEVRIPAVIDMGWTDVNENPIPDWELLNLPQYWPYLYNVSVPVKGNRIAIIQTTRGCPNQCTFCSSGATMGYTPRLRNIDNIAEEVEWLKNRWDINELWIQDDNATVNYERAIELFSALSQFKLHIRLPTGVRFENIDTDMVVKMKRAGVYFTGMGIESGNPRVLKRIKKSFNQDRAETAIAKLARAGIQAIGFFIFGLPTETRQEMNDTLKWAMSTKLHHAQFGIFIPYPGAEDENEKSLLTQDELLKIQRNSTLKFYLRPRIIINFIRNFKWSQLRAMWNHPWIKRWRGAK